MEEAMKDVLKRYGRTIKRDGWPAGEAIIKEHEGQFPDLRKWANAVAVTLHADELLEERRHREGKGPVQKG